MTSTGRNVLILFLIFLLISSVSIPANAQSSDTDQTTYNIEIRPESNLVIGTVIMASDEPRTFSFKHLKDLGYMGQEYSLTLEGDATRIDGPRVKVPSNDGEVRLEYKIQLQPFDNPHQDLMLGLDDSMGIFTMGAIFPIPVNTDRGNIDVNIKTPDDWRVFTAMQSLGNSWSAKSFERLSRTGVAAGEVKYHNSETYYSIPVHNLYFNYSNPYSQIFDLGTHYDLDPTINGRQHMREIAFFTSQFAAQLQTNSPRRIITTPIHDKYWRGWWQPNTGLRRGHVAHHAVHYYFSSNVSLGGFDEGFAMYYADNLAYEYAGERQYLGDRYLRFLILQSAIDRLDESVTYTYIFTPNVVLYIDEVIQEKSGGEHNFADVLAYIVNKEEYRYQEYNKERIPEFTKEAIGIDIEEEFNWALDNPAELTDKIYPTVKEQYYDDFKALLDYQRQEALAPDILYYAYLEMVTAKGVDVNVNTERPVYPVSSYISEVGKMRQFIDDLRAEQPISENEFTTILNEYTNGQSDDFFTYYSTYARDPSLKDLNAYLDGEYTTVIRKQLFVERTIDRIRANTPPTAAIRTDAAKAEDLLHKSRLAMNQHEIDRATQRIQEALSRIKSAREHDQDNDTVPDLQEFTVGLNPTSPDSDADGISDDSAQTEITLDGFAGEWNANETRTSRGDGFIEELSVAKQNENLYILLRFEKPYYEQENLPVKVDGRIGEGHQSTNIFQFNFGEGPVPPGYTNNFALANYTAVGPKVMEIQIPESFLQFKSTPSEIHIQAYRQGDGLARIYDVSVFEESLTPQSGDREDQDSRTGSDAPGDENTDKSDLTSLFGIDTTSEQLILPEGTYQQARITQELALVGSAETSEKPTIAANGPDPALQLEADGIVIDRIEVSNTSGKEPGIKLLSNSNRITNTTFTNVDFGVMLWESSNNTFYLNDFSGAEEQPIETHGSPNAANRWNSTDEFTYVYNGEVHTGRLGNYYPDASGQDANGDGVLDTAYPVYGDQVDNYPLADPPEHYNLGSSPEKGASSTTTNQATSSDQRSTSTQTSQQTVTSSTTTNQATSSDQRSTSTQTSQQTVTGADTTSTQSPGFGVLATIFGLLISILSIYSRNT